MEAGESCLPILAHHGLCGKHCLHFQSVYPLSGSLPLRQTAPEIPEISNKRKSQCDDMWGVAAVNDMDYSYSRMEVFHSCRR